MRVPLFIRRPSPIVRLSGSDIPARPPRVHKRQAHAPETIARVRALVEGTVASHREISERTGVDKGTISRWSARHGWTRPPGACRPAPRPPEARYTPNRIGRALVRDLLGACTRLVDAIVADPRPDPAALAEALDLLARARFEQQIRRRRRLNPPTHPPVRKRKPKRQPGDPPITRRSRRALREALRTNAGPAPRRHDRARARRPAPPRPTAAEGAAGAVRGNGRGREGRRARPAPAPSGR